ncbi:MAG: tRNA (N(6)-L-threonylcarbamoyladenosine(37)-C(2))-methylthiotransferase MtaB [Ruminococcus sp.]|jgi:threonylcarbamoyladenosine tRNA methylthiotransferase MtaB
MGIKVALHNLGCKVNAYETEAMHQMLEENGYEIVDFAPGADVYIINTCTVTNIADRKSRQMLHRARKMNPRALVVAAGCYAQAGTKKLEEDDGIDIIIGNNKKKDLIEILKKYEKDSRKSNNIIDINHTKEYEEMTVSRTTEHTRAYIKVQDGCNQFCTYCIIPFARGRVRSRKKEDVLEEVKRLSEAGCREVVLTGIHLSSYGIDLEEDNLGTLLESVHQIEGIERIRLGSLEPGIITEEFAARMAELPKICPHFHLSLQSGCDETLKRMNRRYRADQYREKCRILRKYYENPALTTDVITGFPGETEEEFEKSYRFVEEMDFYEIHVFKYSRRQGTKAAVMDGQVDEQVKSERSTRMIAMGERKKREYLEKYLGRTLEILLEEKVMIGEEAFWIGHTPQYLKVAVRDAGQHSNEFQRVQARTIGTNDVIMGVRI